MRNCPRDCISRRIYDEFLSPIGVPAKFGHSSGDVFISTNFFCHLSEILGIGVHMLVRFAIIEGFIVCFRVIASKERIAFTEIAEMRVSSSEKYTIIIRTNDKKTVAL